MELLGFCILMATIVACDTWVFLRGYNAMFHWAKTDDEKALRVALIKRETNGISPHHGATRNE